MTPPGRPDSASSFAQLWIDALSAVLAQIASAPFPFDAAEAAPETGAPNANDLHVTITAGGGVRGEMSLRIPQATVLDLVRIFIGDAETGVRELTADDRSGVEELLRQIAGQVSTAAKPNWGEMPLTVTLSETPTWPPAAGGWIASSPAAPRQVGLEWKLSAALLSALLAAWQEDAPPVPSSSSASAGPSGGALDPGNLGFFMDVELDVTLRFGGKDILLKEILDLGPGSVLELDREIQDPADLLLDGKLIARGELVMVNGNYGLRVTEVFTNSQSAA
jgi:flagellar motor switch protein FliN/FliY